MSSPNRVLIVDDDDDVRETLEIILTDEGLEVMTAANGREALQVLRTRRPDVVLLDLLMPEMDGWQTIDALRAEGLRGEVRVVICTSAPKDAPEGFPVLAKPIDLNELLAEVTANTR
jgi:CheY-like chemotaxis protein